MGRVDNEIADIKRHFLRHLAQFTSMVPPTARNLRSPIHPVPKDRLRLPNPDNDPPEEAWPCGRRGGTARVSWP
jgi:hypothetical protein